MPYSEVDDRPWIINSNSNKDTANTAMESEISSGLRPKKEAPQHSTSQGSSSVAKFSQ